MSGPGRIDLTHLHAVVPLRGLAGGKARLGDAADGEEREALLLGMLLHVVAVLRGWPPCERIHVVTGDAVVARLAHEAGASAVLEIDQGMNAAIALGRDTALASGATALLILPADLPHLREEALERLLDAADAALAAGSGAPVVVVSPSDARGGTNALLLAPPGAIEPCFGVASLEAHVRAAASAEASVVVVVDAALGFDLDTPDDLERIDATRLAELTALGAGPVASAAE